MSDPIKYGGDKDTGINAGKDIPPPSPHRVFEWLAERTYLTQLVAACVSWLNLKVIVQLLLPDGTQSSVTVYPSITEKDSVLTIPIDLSSLTGGGSGSANVPYSGVGAPAAGTLSALVTYVTSPVPSLYADMTPGAQKLYVCTTAGTYNVGQSGGSVWAQIGSGRGGGGGGGNVNMRGLANPETTYALYDAVKMPPGPAAGVYWSLMDNNTNAPDSGVGWMLIATVQGPWI